MDIVPVNNGHSRIIEGDIQYCTRKFKNRRRKKKFKDLYSLPEKNSPINRENNLHFHTIENILLFCAFTGMNF
jgi:hypothetical protein